MWAAGSRSQVPGEYHISAISVAMVTGVSLVCFFSSAEGPGPFSFPIFLS